MQLGKWLVRLVVDLGGAWGSCGQVRWDLVQLGKWPVR